MNELFRNTLSPAQWAVLAAVPPAIVALYFLKLKRVPLEVPSTYLWLKSIEDLRVNSLWQRLRQSLLLLLQLLVVALAILALLRPGWQGTDLTGGRLIFVVDNSASMSTEDAGEAADASRLDVAKEQVAGLIDQMDRGMTAMIVSFAGEPTVVQQFTDNTRLLRERLATIEPTAGRTDLLGALELADGLANPAGLSVQEGAPEVEVVAPEPATLFIFSDGRFTDVKDFALGNLDPVYVPLGSADTANLAITAVETRRSEAQLGELQAFVQAANFSGEAVDAVVELRRGGRLLDAQRLAIPAGETAGVTLPIGDASPTSGGSLEARLGADTLSAAKDRLPIDDKAFAAINDSRTGRTLLVTPGNVPVEQALATGRVDRIGEIAVEAPAFLESKTYERQAAAAGYDLVIFDRCAPETAPRASTVYLGELPPGSAWLGPQEANGQQPIANRQTTVPQIIDWNRTHPLLAHVELGNFEIVETRLLTPPAGSTVLIDAAEGPLAAIAARDGYEDLVIGFPILAEVDGALLRNTDWINRHSFPTFWLNVLEYFVARQAAGLASVRPGDSVELRPRSPATETVRVTTPSGGVETLRRRGEQPFVFRQTEEVGVYRVAEGGEEAQRFAVNLFAPNESDVRLRTGETPEESDAAVVASLKIGNIDVAATAGATPARKELWRLLLLLALGLLLLEWYVYHRRVYL